MPGRNRHRAAGPGAALRPDAVGWLVGRAHVLFYRCRRFVEGAGARRRCPRAGGHAAALRADRKSARSAQGRRTALRRGGARLAMARAQPPSLARDCPGGRGAMSAILVAVNGPQAAEWLDTLRAHAK